MRVETVQVPGISNGRSCKSCSHVNVCAVYRAIAPLLNSFEDRKPFDPADLAKVCIEYVPVY